LMAGREKGFSGLDWAKLGGVGDESFRERQHVG